MNHLKSWTISIHKSLSQIKRLTVFNIHNLIVFYYRNTLKDLFLKIKNQVKKQDSLQDILEHNLVSKFLVSKITDLSSGKRAL